MRQAVTDGIQGIMAPAPRQPAIRRQITVTSRDFERTVEVRGRRQPNQLDQGDWIIADISNHSATFRTVK